MWEIKDSNIEKAVLVGIKYPDSKITIEESLSELFQLAKTAGAEVKAQFTQKRKLPHQAHYIGKGKLQELKEYVTHNSINVVIVDDELSPTQESNLEEEVGCKVIARTRLILDIFALHASSSVGKLQVELAQMEYYLPRLKNIWTEFSRLGGGIGTRGPGEKKIEIDKRIISDRITGIKRKLKIIAGQRRDRRKQRKESLKKNICLVGYTNSGKSTLMNQITGSKVEVANKLFATLSPVTRNFMCGKYEILLTDTVGFIRKLPHQLVEAFMATLEQVREADMLLHVVDISSEHYRHQIEAVRGVLGELKALDIPIMRIYNKIDKVDCELNIDDKNLSAVYVSGLENKGIDRLKGRIEKYLDGCMNEIVFKIPQARQDVINSIYRNACVVERTYDENDIVLKCYIEKEYIQPLRSYVIE